jgi:hypothetical protein
METYKFITRDGIEKHGFLIRKYPAFEGGMRYIFQTDNGEYRCVKDENGKYIEYVA